MFFNDSMGPNNLKNGQQFGTYPQPPDKKKEFWIPPSWVGTKRLRPKPTPKDWCPRSKEELPPFNWFVLDEQPSPEVQKLIIDLTSKLISKKYNFKFFKNQDEASKFLSILKTEGLYRLVIHMMPVWTNGDILVCWRWSICEWIRDAIHSVIATLLKRLKPTNKESSNRLSSLELNEFETLSKRVSETVDEEVRFQELVLVAKYGLSKWHAREYATLKVMSQISPNLSYDKSDELMALLGKESNWSLLENEAKRLAVLCDFNGRNLKHIIFEKLSEFQIEYQQLIAMDKDSLTLAQKMRKNQLEAYLKTKAQTELKNWNNLNSRFMLDDDQIKRLEQFDEYIAMYNAESPSSKEKEKKTTSKKLKKQADLFADEQRLARKIKKNVPAKTTIWKDWISKEWKTGWKTSRRQAEFICDTSFGCWISEMPLRRELIALRWLRNKNSDQYTRYLQLLMYNSLEINLEDAEKIAKTVVKEGYDLWRDGGIKRLLAEYKLIWLIDLLDLIVLRARYESELDIIMTRSEINELELLDNKIKNKDYTDDNKVRSSEKKLWLFQRFTQRFSRKSKTGTGTSLQSLIDRSGELKDKKNAYIKRLEREWDFALFIKLSMRVSSYLANKWYFPDSPYMLD